MSKRDAINGFDSQKRKRDLTWSVGNILSPRVLLIASTVLLCALGLLMVFSSTSVSTYETAFWAAGGTMVSVLEAVTPFLKQAALMVAGVVSCVIFAKIGATKLMEIPLKGAWAVVLLLLMLTLVFGNESHGATRWLQIGSFQLQPSELAKIVVIMTSSRVFAKYSTREINGMGCIRGLALYAGLPMVLIGMERDLGTLIIIGVTLLFMAILAGVRLKVFVIILGLSVLAVAVLIAVEPYRLNRLLTYWQTDASDQSWYYDEGWQPIHGQYAFASGGLFGLGIGESRQKYSWLPEADNDYIFAIIGEEMGFVGTMGVLALFGVFTYAGFRIGIQARERMRFLDIANDRVSVKKTRVQCEYSWLLAISLSIIIAFQAFINFAGVTGLLPLSGRPVPFISSGGTSIIASLTMVGLILGVSHDTLVAERAYKQRMREQAKSTLKVIETPNRGLTTVSGGRRGQSRAQSKPRGSFARERDDQ